MKLKTEHVVLIVVFLLLMQQRESKPASVPGQYNTGVANSVGFVF